MKPNGVLVLRVVLPAKAHAPFEGLDCVAAAPASEREGLGLEFGWDTQRRQWEVCLQMGIAALVLVVLGVIVTAAVVIAAFIWAAVKDGQEDQALQARLGIRRRTRLGR